MNYEPTQSWWRKPEIGRMEFLLWGLGLCLLKYGLDWAISSFLFATPWTLFDYQRPAALTPSASTPVLLLTLLAISLPFLAAGTLLTLRRLRSAGLPLWLVILFVVPVVKFVLFAVLCLLPPRTQAAESNPAGDGEDRPQANRHVWRASLGILVAVTSMLPVVWLGTTVLKDYGWALFAGVPFCLGFISSLVYDPHHDRPLRNSILIALCAVALAGALLIFVAMEGLICLLMAAPIAGLLAILGAVVAYAIRSATNSRNHSKKLYCPAILVVPLVMGVEHFTKPEAPLLEVTSAVEVNAPPEAVWRNVVTFSELPPPKEWLFRAGIAYPVRAEIQGQGRGAVRYCCFSTGPFVEPIEVWDEPRLLRFAVTENPAPMQELSPYPNLHPPHLEGFLVSQAGQFRLVPLAGGRTRLEGTTWYQHNLWPATYWRWWSDYIIHRIHLRVLNHVKELSEKGRDGHEHN